MEDDFFQMLPSHGAFPLQYGEDPEANTVGLGKLPVTLLRTAYLHCALSSPLQQGGSLASSFVRQPVKAHCVSL